MRRSTHGSPSVLTSIIGAVIASSTMGRRAVVCVALLAATSTWARAECPPIAIPHGDATLVATLNQRLSSSGISTTARAMCPSVRVQVERRGELVHLRVTDAFERLGEREVQDVATAAAIIESWTLQEIETGSLSAIEEAAHDTPPPVAVGRLVRPGIAISARSAMTGDAATWVGGSIAGCAAAGPVCIGATLRATRDTNATGATTSVDHELTQLDALATVELPRRLAGFVVSPALSAGYAWLGISSQHLDIHMMPVTTTESSHALRAGAQLRVARSLTSHVAIIGELAGDASLARTTPATGPAGPATALGFALGARFELP